MRNCYYKRKWCGPTFNNSYTKVHIGIPNGGNILSKVEGIIPII